MKVLHILEEISKKNHSVVIVSKIFSSYKVLKNRSRVISSIKFFEINNFLKKNRPDILHIHGMWRIIHLGFMINAKLLKIPIILQPHGMLLEQAIKSKSLLKYFLKLFLILFYRYVIRSFSFVAVTQEEKISILKYFKKSQIKVIYNPFITSFKISKKTNNHFSFFGRINKHKNLDLIIQSFINSNINNKWKLLIYGINDDYYYKNQLINLIKKNKFQDRIFFKKPIFDKKIKFQIMSKNFLNILMSKSEILNLSVLESLSVGTKSLVSDNIKYPKKISNLLYFSKPNVKILSKKINAISKIQHPNFKNKNIIMNKFKKNYSFEIIEKKYLDFLKSLLKTN